MTLLHHPWTGILGWALLHFRWQGLLVWLGVALGLRLLRHSRPTARYAVACGGLLLCLALPVSGVLKHFPPSEATSLPLQTIVSGETEPMAEVLPVQAERAPLAQRLDAHLPLIVLLWALGASLLSLRFASGLAWVRSLGREEALPEAEAWRARLVRLAHSLGIARPVLLRAAQGLESPVAAGIWRPVIFLPASLLTGMPPELVEALLAHELAHIRRHDYLVNLVQSAIEVLLFYHPAVWWISRRIRIEREQICDDLAAGALGEPRRLALALQELDLLQLSTPHLAQGAHGGNLMNRIRRLIHPEPRPLAWKALASILGVTAACATTAFAAPFHREGPRTSAPPQVPQAAAPAIPAEPPQPPRPPKPTEPPPPPEAPRAHMNYVFVRPDGRMSCSGSRDCMKEVQELKKSHPGGFLWFRDGGRSYVIDDPAEVARLQELYRPMDELGRKMKDLGREMKAQGAKMKTMGAEMKEASRQGRPHSQEMKALGHQMGSLGREMGELHRRRAALQRRLGQDAQTAERQNLDKQMAELDRQIQTQEKKMEALGRSMEEVGRKLEEAHGPMEGVGKRMEEAGHPMDKMGAQMGALGSQMGEEGRKLDAALRQLAEESLTKGKATPLPR